MHKILCGAKDKDLLASWLVAEGRECGWMFSVDDVVEAGGWLSGEEQSKLLGWALTGGATLSGGVWMSGLLCRDAKGIAIGLTLLADLQILAKAASTAYALQGVAVVCKAVTALTPVIRQFLPSPYKHLVPVLVGMGCGYVQVLDMINSLETDLLKVRDVVIRGLSLRCGRDFMGEISKESAQSQAIRLLLENALR